MGGRPIQREVSISQVDSNSQPQNLTFLGGNQGTGMSRFNSNYSNMYAFPLRGPSTQSAMRDYNNLNIIQPKPCPPLTQQSAIAIDFNNEGFGRNTFVSKATATFQEPAKPQPAVTRLQKHRSQTSSEYAAPKANAKMKEPKKRGRKSTDFEDYKKESNEKI